MGEIPTYAHPLDIPTIGATVAVGLHVVELDVVMDEIEDCLHPLPARRSAAE